MRQDKSLHGGAQWQKSSGGEVLISRPRDERLLPRSLRLSLGELEIQFCVRVPIDVGIDSRPISLALVAIIESAMVSRSLAKKQESYAYLYPRSL